MQVPWDRKTPSGGRAKALQGSVPCSRVPMRHSWHLLLPFFHWEADHGGRAASCLLQRQTL